MIWIEVGGIGDWRLESGDWRLTQRNLQSPQSLYFISRWIGLEHQVRDDNRLLGEKE